MKKFPKMSVRQLVDVEDKTDVVVGTAIAVCIPRESFDQDEMSAVVDRAMALAKSAPKLSLQGGETQREVAEKVAILYRRLSEFIESHLKDFDE